MIKAIIFDFGNVICRFTNEFFLDRISAINGQPKEKLRELFYNTSGLPKKYETGLLSSQEFFEELSKLFELNIPYNELKTIYSKDKFTQIEGMAQLINSLKEKYKIGLLSNTSDWDHDYMVKVAPEINSFNTITLSYEVKAMKPKLEIFYDALNKLKLPPQDCVYIDDILEYVQAAESIGMKGIHFTSLDNFKASLKSFNII